MAEKRNILEEAILDVKRIQDALNANTKEILRSVAKEEIDSVVKESLEGDYDEEDLEPVPTPADAENGADGAEGGKEGGEGAMGPEASMGVDDIGGSEEVGSDQELGMDADALGGELDMTAASDDEVIAIYKKLSGEDEIEVIGDEIHLSISEPGEYVIKTNEKAAAVPAAPEAGLGGDDLGSTGLDSLEAGDETGLDGLEGGETGDAGDAGDDTSLAGLGGPEGGEEGTDDLGGEEETEEVMYEIAMDGDEPEEEIEENSTRTNVNYRNTSLKPNTPGFDSAKKGRTDESVTSQKGLITEQKYNALLTESTRLKSENEQFRQALKKFRTMLVETVVFNSNLTYVTKLFTEHTTSKDEKAVIIKRFDEEATSLVESKKLYKSLTKELTSRKPISESLEKKTTKNITSGAQQLTESTVYVDSSTTRIMDLINRVEKR